MTRYLGLLFSLFLLTACMVVPVKDKTYIAKCEISSDRKTLKVIDGFKNTNTYYSISGLVLYPISGVISGTYVAINNVYNMGEETLICQSKSEGNS